MRYAADVQGWIPLVLVAERHSVIAEDQEAPTPPGGIRETAGDPGGIRAGKQCGFQSGNLHGAREASHMPAVSQQPGTSRLQGITTRGCQLRYVVTMRGSVVSSLPGWAYTLDRGKRFPGSLICEGETHGLETT